MGGVLAPDDDRLRYSYSSTHESLLIEPWEELPGGVRVSHVDDPGQPIMLLRDADEVSTFVGHMLIAQHDSERRKA